MYRICMEICLHLVYIVLFIMICFQLLSGELTFTLNFKMRLSRPVRDEMILREMSENINMKKQSKLNLNHLRRVAAHHLTQHLSSIN